MSRQLSWYPLASSDPVPGDPVAVRVAGQDYQQVAQAINSAAGALEQIASIEGNVSYAVDEIRQKATDVAGDIRRAYDRYDRVGAALVEYASALDSAQVESEAALRDAQNAQHAIDSAGTTIASASRSLNDAVDEDEKTLHQNRLDRARHARDDAEIQLAAARRRLDDAVALRDSAARTAGDKVHDITGSDGLRDSLWDNLNLGAICSVISDIAGLVASVAGILALVLCWVPVLGQALATVALIASAVKLVADLALALFDDGSWADVAWGVVAVASFGVGRVLSFAAQGVTRGAAGVARLAAGRVGALSRAIRSGLGFPTTSAASVIRTLTGPTTGALSRTAARSLAGEVRASSWLGNGLQSLKPSAIWADASKLGPFLHDAGAWRTAMTQAGQNFRLAGSNPAALFAASQADEVLVQAIRTSEQVAPSLASYAPQVHSALVGAVTTQAGSFTAVSAGAFDAAVGMQQTSTTLSSGAPYQLPVVENVQSIIDWFDPSPAEQLNLVAR